MKVTNISEKLVNLRGIDFPPGETVLVDEATGKKCLSLGVFEVWQEPQKPQKPRKAKSNGKNKD